LQAITTYKIVEIFNSIEGEGKRAGATATFIRLAGCNLRCTYCDTTYSYGEKGGEYQTMTLDEIITLVNNRRFFRVTITGGEPLLAPGVNMLINHLLTEGCEVNIETNGSVDITSFISITDKLFFTIDYKLPSSGVTDKMFLQNYDKLRPWDVLKFVVGSDADLKHMIDVIKKLKSNPQIYIGAVYDSYPLQNIVTAMLDNPILKDTHLQLQFHKIIWNVDQRGV